MEIEIKHVTEGQIDEVEKNFQKAVTYLKNGSFSLRSCYVLANPSVEDFRIFRDDIKTLALIFKDGLYPVSCTSVGNLKSFMDYYLALEFDDWKDNLEDIAKDASTYAEVLQTLVRSYTYISVDFRKNKDRVAEVSKKIQMSESRQLEQEKAKMKEAGDAQWWGGLFTTLTVGIWDGGNEQKAKSALNQATAAKYEASMCVAALESVEKNLVPAINNFVDAMSQISGFFNVLTNEVKEFQAVGDKALEDRKKLHYTIMKKKAQRIQNSCNAYLFVAPDFVSDLMCIPPSDKPNYVEQWLAEQSQKDPEQPSLAESWQSEAFKEIAKPMIKAVKDKKAVTGAASPFCFMKMLGLSA